MIAFSYDEWLTRYGHISDTKRRAGLGGAFALLLVVYVGLIAYPNVDALDTLDAAIVQAEQKKRDKAHFAGDLEQVRADVLANQQKLAALHDVLPDETDLPQFLAQLGQMARELDIVIERLEPQSEATHEFYAEVGLHVQMRGGFHQIATLIDQLGNLPRIVTVNNVVFSDPKPQDQHIVVQGQMGVSIYRFLTEAQQAALLAEKAKKP